MATEEDLVWKLIMAREFPNNQAIRNRLETSSPSGKRLYTLKEAAQYLGLTEWSVRDLVYSGRIYSVRFPGDKKYYLDVAGIVDFIRKHKFCHQQDFG